MPHHAIVMVLSAVMLASMTGPFHEEALAALAPAGSLPENCGVGALTPTHRHGLITARGEAECTDLFPYIRLKVGLQIRVESHVWRKQAVAIGETPFVTDYYLVKVAHPCKLGPFRTNVTFKYRYDTGDPWTLAVRGFHSPGTLIRSCAS
jgi:hypothetical protein